MNIQHAIILLVSVFFATLSYGQDKGTFSGGFQSNANFFIRDSLIGAANIPQYDRQLYGAEAWLNLGYRRDGYSAGIRFDLFNNSNRLDPNNSYTDQGIGRWYIAKQMEKLGVTVGYIYNQIGSGSIFRAYEQRPQLIDNALVGAQLTYQVGEEWQATVFTGRQRDLFETFDSVIKGGKFEGFVSLGEESPINLAPGIGFVNRTLDDITMNRVIGIVKDYIPKERFKPTYNVYLGSIYNTLTYKNFSWYFEAAYKSQDVFNDPMALIEGPNGSRRPGKYRRDDGNMVYTSLSFAKNKLGITVEGKRTENFNFRVDPTLARNFGLVNFLPPMNRVNTYRLTARYSPATQDLSELAVQVDLKYRVKKNFNVNINFSNITDLSGDLQLYRELYLESIYKIKRTWRITSGVQFLTYNQEIYEVKPEVPLVNTVVPYFDILYKIDRKKSVRFEGQYMFIGDDEKKGLKQDYGDWVFGLLEYNIAPHWSFVASDMFNIDPGTNAPSDESGEKLSLHYPRFDVFYKNGNNRYGLSYIKQVEGIVCTGGICRLEPAFSGYQFSVNSTF